ncbi:MAG: hypothetical protein ACRDRS_02395 [Pseudonocardiaceae bacterium]
MFSYGTLIRGSSRTAVPHTPPIQEGKATMTLEVSVGVLLVCLGLLLGSTWTIQALQARFRRLALERRRLNEEWLALRAALQRQRRGRCRCRRCGAPPAEWRDQSGSGPQ